MKKVDFLVSQADASKMVSFTKFIDAVYFADKLSVMFRDVKIWRREEGRPILSLVVSF